MSIKIQLNYFFVISLIGHSSVTSLLIENSRESVHINWPFNREFTFTINIDKMIMKYFFLIFYSSPSTVKGTGCIRINII